MTDAAAELVDRVRADARAKLLDLLDEVSGRKVLLLDNSIFRPLDMIVKPVDLKDHGVQQWHKLSDQSIQTDCSQMIFLVRCTRLELMDWIAKQILDDEAQNKDRLYVVVLVPRKTEQCAERLRRANVRANVRIVECGLYFFPFDRDILSMETPGVFHDFHVQGDASSAFYVAKAMMYLQGKFGVAPSVHSIGGAGKTVVDVLLRLRKEEAVREASQEPQPAQQEMSQKGIPPVAPRSKGNNANQKEKEAAPPVAAGPRISEVIVIDRRVDLYSVLCTQFTYQALIDMVYGVNNNQTDIGSAEWAKEKSPQLRLSPEDAFYREIRDLHIDRLGPLLQEKARAIQKTYAEKDNAKTPSEMAEYIKKFKTAQLDHPLLEIHINLAHDLRDAIQREEYRSDLRLEDEITAQSSHSCLEVIENFIDDQRPFHEVMRLLCLYSLVNNGIKAKTLDVLKKGLIQAYGYKHLLTLCNLERVGMLNYQSGKSSWSGVKQNFSLLVDDSQVESDISYAYSGYAPLSVRLVQTTKSLQRGWRSCPDALNLLYGPAQHVPQASSDPVPEGSAAVALVVFVGGVTHGEVAALRKLSELEEGRRKFLIVTTEFTNVKKLFESMQCEQVFNQAPIEAAKVAAPKDERRGFGGFWPGGR